MKLTYVPKKFRPETLALITLANTIVEEYAAQGFDLTLRQLYYQLVARGKIPNKVQEYNRLGQIIGDARLAGLTRWDRIVDRTRNVRSVSHWDDPSSVISSAAWSFRIDKWEGQAYRPQVWIEKDALVGVIEGVCNRNDVPFFACRGYVSLSEMWGSAQKFRQSIKAGQVPVIIHLGDHDPSGIDMSRDLEDRMLLLGAGKCEVYRIALNMAQVEELNPPPNPAKSTDSRFTGYLDKYGDESWELDALSPAYIAGIIQDQIDDLRDPDKWAAKVEEEREGRRFLRLVSENWGMVADEIRDWEEYEQEGFRAAGADPDD